MKRQLEVELLFKLQHLFRSGDSQDSTLFVPLSITLIVEIKSLKSIQFFTKIVQLIYYCTAWWNNLLSHTKIRSSLISELFILKSKKALTSMGSFTNWINYRSASNIWSSDLVDLWVLFKLQITFSELQTIKCVYLWKESSLSYNFLYNTPLESPSFSNFFGGGVYFLTFFDFWCKKRFCLAFQKSTTTGWLAPVFLLKIWNLKIMRKSCNLF